MSLGKHYLAEYFGCDESVINDRSAVENIMMEAARIAGVTIIKPFFHEFSPHGISGVVVIAESHFAVHTWPEHSYAAVDMFSCGDFNSEDALRYIETAVSAERCTVSLVERGHLTGSGPVKKAEIEHCFTTGGPAPEGSVLGQGIGSGKP